MRAVSKEQLEIEITHAKVTGSNLRGDKGVNFPSSDIRLPALTEADTAKLPFIAEHADAVGLSFTSEPADVLLLQAALEKISSAQARHHLQDRDGQGLQRPAPDPTGADAPLSGGRDDRPRRSCS